MNWNLARFLTPITAALLLAACASTELRMPEPDTSCRSGSITLDSRFESGQLGQCDPGRNGSFTLTLYPEDAPPINDSPWYSFRVSGEPGTQFTIRI